MEIFEVCKNGKKFKAYSQDIIDDVMNWNFWRDGFENWEPETFNIFDIFLSQDKDLLDIGAWVGPTSIYGSLNSRNVVSVEPDPVAFDFLSKNIQLNNISNITLLNKACSNDPAVYINSKYCFGSSMSFVSSEESGGNSIKVDGVSVSDLLSFGEFSLIKMDIEGYEEILIPDNIDLILNIPLFLSIHKPFYIDPSNLLESLSLYNFVYNEKLQKIDISQILVNDFDSFLFLPGDINDFR